MKIKSISFCILVCISNYVNACSCDDYYQTFTKSIENSHVIFSAIVLEHIPIPKIKRSEPLLSYQLKSYSSLTKLKVTTWYQNKMKSDTIYYGNGQSSACDGSINGVEIGKHLILKAYDVSWGKVDRFFLKNEDSELKDFIGDYSDKPIIGYEICDVGYLKLKNNSVVGHITKNYQVRRRKFENLIQIFSKKWAQELRNQKMKLQEMEIERFNRIMRRKCRG